jgi:hypothetical protein
MRFERAASIRSGFGNKTVMSGLGEQSPRPLFLLRRRFTAVAQRRREEEEGTSGESAVGVVGV